MNHEYYVLHVKEGFEERKKSILAQFLRLQIPVQWILAHDISEISQTDLQKYNYQGSLRNQEISCCLKHIAAWEKIAAGPHAGGFVFEDDVPNGSVSWKDDQSVIVETVPGIEEKKDDVSPPARHGYLVDIRTGKTRELKSAVVR